MTDQAVDAPPSGPRPTNEMSTMECARELVSVTREINSLEAQVDTKKKRADQLKQRVEFDMDNGNFPESFSHDGASVHKHRQVWAGPATSHADLAAVLTSLNEVELLPKTVHAGALSAYVREFLDPDENLTLEERLLSPEPKAMDPQLLAALKVVKKEDVRVTGAGPATKETT